MPKEGRQNFAISNVRALPYPAPNHFAALADEEAAHQSYTDMLDYGSDDDAPPEPDDAALYVPSPDDVEIGLLVGTDALAPQVTRKKRAREPSPAPAENNQPEPAPASSEAEWTQAGEASRAKRARKTNAKSGKNAKTAPAQATAADIAARLSAHFNRPQEKSGGTASQPDVENDDGHVAQAEMQAGDQNERNIPHAAAQAEPPAETRPAPEPLDGGPPAPTGSQGGTDAGAAMDVGPDMTQAANPTTSNQPAANPGNAGASNGALSNGNAPGGAAQGAGNPNGLGGAPGGAGGNPAGGAGPGGNGPSGNGPGGNGPGGNGPGGNGPQHAAGLAPRPLQVGFTPIPQGVEFPPDGTTPETITWNIKQETIDRWNAVPAGTKLLLVPGDYKHEDNQVPLVDFVSGIVAKRLEKPADSIAVFPPAADKLPKKALRSPPHATLGAGFTPQEMVDLLAEPILAHRDFPGKVLFIFAYDPPYSTFLMDIEGFAAAKAAQVPLIAAEIRSTIAHSTEVQRIINDFHERVPAGTDGMDFFTGSLTVNYVEHIGPSGILAKHWIVRGNYPTHDPVKYLELRNAVRELEYNSIYGPGKILRIDEDSDQRCAICYSFSHVSGLCPLPLIPGWYGPLQPTRTGQPPQTPINSFTLAGSAPLPAASSSSSHRGRGQGRGGMRGRGSFRGRGWRA